MHLRLNLDMSAKIGLVSLFAIFFGLHHITGVHKARGEDATYAQRGVTTQGLVTNQLRHTRTVGKKHKSNITTYEIMVVFKLSDGTPVYKSTEMYFPVTPATPGGPLTVEVTYLPEAPSTSARIRDEIPIESSDAENPIWPGILGLLGGVGGLSLACYREKEAFRRLFDKFT